MFGYVVADRSKLTQPQLDRYQSCYCGLCHCIGVRHGTIRRAALNYDMTFLVLLLSSLYEPEEETVFGRCLPHPVRKHTHWSNSITEYAADMNMALAFHNCMDDWHDDRKWKSLFLAWLFRPGAKKAETAYPRQWNAISTCMSKLRTIETEDHQDPDAGANAFGSLMAELFVYQEDHWAPLLRRMGHALGRYIYLLDAVMDLDDDLKRGSYNPLRSRAENGLSKEDFLPILKLMIGDCTDAFERLPLLQDLGLMRNILYSGVWSRFYQSESGKGKEAIHHD